MGRKVRLSEVELARRVAALNRQIKKRETALGAMRAARTRLAKMLDKRRQRARKALETGPVLHVKQRFARMAARLRDPHPSLGLGRTRCVRPANPQAGEGVDGAAA